VAVPFLVYVWLLDRRPERRWAKAAFHYSLLYLALLFVAMAVDAAIR
jgi:heme o synthase